MKLQISPRKETLVFFLIIFLSLFIRIYNLTNNPPGFFTDEASAAYNAHSVLKTGRDEYGVSFPVFFRALGEYKNPVYVYSAIPFIFLFGLKEFSIRFTSAIYGVLTIIILFFYTKRLFNKKVAFLSIILLAISPWHIHYSRIGFEQTSAVFWTITSFYFLQKSLSRTFFYPFACVSLIFSFLSYGPPKFYLPPLIIAFILINFRVCIRWIKNWKIMSATFLGLFILVFLIYPYIANGAFFARWDQVKLPQITANHLVQGYLNHFSTSFLFKHGEVGFPGSFIARQSIPGIGQFYWFQLPFLLIGIISVFFINKNKKNLFFTIIFLIIYPLSSIFTTTIPSATHSIIGVIPISILTAIGISHTHSFINSNKIQRVFTLVLSSIVGFSFIYFLYLLTNYPLYSADYWGWQYGYKEVVKYFKNKEKDFDEFFVTHRFNYGEELLKFYDARYKCRECFVMNNPIKINVKKKQLFALRHDDIEEAKKIYSNAYRFSVKKIIYLPNKKPEIFIGFFIQ